MKGKIGEVFWLTSILFHPPFFMRNWHFIQQRRSYSIPEKQVLTPAWWWLREIRLRLFFRGEGKNFLRDRLHDRWVSRRVARWKPHMVIGSEKSCRDSFLAVKKYKGLCILDLAQIHVDELEKIRNEHGFLKKEWGNDGLFEKIRKVKIMEYDLADYILVISARMKHSLLSVGIPEKKIFSVTLGFQPQIFFRKKEWKISASSPFNLIFVGNLCEAKGILFLVSIMRCLQHFPITLTLIGSNASYFRKKTNLSNILFEGILDPPAVANQLRHADVFVFPSYSDSWGMAVIEAMASGLPVIVGREVGAAEVIDEHSGFVLPLITETWIRAILFLYFHFQQRISMGTHASEKVANLTWENYQSRVNLFFCKVSGKV